MKTYLPPLSAGEDAIKLVGFAVGGVRYGIDIMQVRGTNCHIRRFTFRQRRLVQEILLFQKR